MNVIITGASKGFGKSIAKIFASHGHNIYICARSTDKLYAVQKELQSQYPGAGVEVMPCDLSLPEEAKAFGKWFLSFNVAPDVLVNNAGLFDPGSVYDEPEGTLERMIAVNLYSAYHLTRTLIPEMTTRRHGHIFNMCSIASLKAYPNGGAYSISKFALAGFSKNLREEMKPFGVKVTAVYPGAAYTDSWAGSGVDPSRIMEADDIARMIYAASLLSPQACVEDIVLRPQLGDL
ncbi:MAG: SDR family NAD(P)-dependent oxidoreductase [Sphingobacteriales bacterium]|nr:SDR family NAD(P)-dependent oxidoreductase [Sphingobacteriales bacterium]OJY91429.1 MAG: short-chain dehydrogenase [Sphingobacteriales bacterium 44-15]